MKICFDTETEMIGGTFGLAPPLITCGMYIVQEKDGEFAAFVPALGEVLPNADSYHMSQTQDTITLVLNKSDTITVFKWLLLKAKAQFIVHNAAFDLAVLCAADAELIPLVFKGLDENRFHCTYLREMMLTILYGNSLEARGFSLKDLVRDLLSIELEKDQGVRTSFSAVKNLAIADWPKEYFEYLLGDIHHLYSIYRHQEQRKDFGIAYESGKLYNGLADSHARVRAVFALYLASCRGLKVDMDAVLGLKNSLEPKLHEIEKKLVEEGFATFTKKKEGDTKSSLIKLDKKAIQKYLESQGVVKTTEKGNIETSAEVLESCGHPVLEELAKFGGSKTVLSTYVPALLAANQTPAKVLHPKFFPFSETGRVNGRAPNLLNLPRDGGVRECFVAREGYCFVFSDYDAAEMRTFAQALLDIVGTSKLAERYQQDPNFDPHSYLAAEYLKIPYEEGIEKKSKGDKAFKKIRQLMKAANFGFLGGSSAKTFLLFAKGYGITDITLEDATRLRNFYLSVFPEVRKYFNWISTQINRNPNNEVDILLKRSGRIAGKRRYTQACNVFVQGVAADGALKSFYEITKACFDKKSIFWGCRPVLFIHDEIIVEAPIHKAPQVALEVQRHMQESMQIFTPNVPSSCSPSMALRWYKNAEPIYDENGVLQIWEPKK